MPVLPRGSVSYSLNVKIPFLYEMITVDFNVELTVFLF